MQHTTAAHVHLHNTHSYEMKWNQNQRNTDGNCQKKTKTLQFNLISLHYSLIILISMITLCKHLHTYKLSNSLNVLRQIR